jgi:LPS export ABC transporter protein LptC
MTVARLKNTIFVLILVFLFVEVLIIFPKHLEKIEADPAVPEQSHEDAGAEQKMKGIHLVESQRGSRDWELFANAAEGTQGKGAWDLHEVKVQFYNQEKIDFVVTGKGGSIDSESRNLKIAGDVKITSNNGYIFESEEVLYQAKKREIVSPGPIFMKGPKDSQGDGLQVHGAQMLVEIDQSKMTVRDHIRAEKNMHGSRRFDLISDLAEFSGRHREARFTGNVVINYDSTKIEGPSAAFLYNSKKQTLKNIIFSGGVRVSNDDKYALSDEMNLDVEANKFTFTGQPRVYQNSDELSGQQIIFLDGGKKVKVENIRATMDDKKKAKPGTEKK